MSQETQTWPDLALGLFEGLTGRGAEIAYKFEDMHVSVPSGTGSESRHAEWIFSGTLRITTSDNGSSPN